MSGSEHGDVRHIYTTGRVKSYRFSVFLPIMKWYQIRVKYGVYVLHPRLSKWYPLKSLSVSHAEHASMSAPREQSPATMSPLSMPENASTAEHVSTCAPLPPWCYSKLKRPRSSDRGQLPIQNTIVFQDHSHVQELPDELDDLRSR